MNYSILFIRRRYEARDIRTPCVRMTHKFVSFIALPTGHQLACLLGHHVTVKTVVYRRLVGSALCDHQIKGGSRVRFSQTSCLFFSSVRAGNNRPGIINGHDYHINSVPINRCRRFQRRAFVEIWVLWKRKNIVQLLNIVQLDKHRSFQKGCYQSI